MSLMLPDHPTVDLEALRLFCAVARARSFSRVARERAIPLATLSRRISALERQLDAQLLRRTTRRVEPTDAGSLLLERSEPALAQVDSAVECLSEESGRARGRLRITVPADFARHWLAAPLAGFALRHPDIRLELDVTDRVVNLVEERLDLAIRLGEQPDSSLVARRLATVANGLYASPGYLAALPPLAAPGDVEQLNALTLRGRRADREWRLKHGRREVTVTPRGNLTLNDMGALVALTTAGAGVALLPAPFVEPAVRSGALTRVLPEWEGPSTPVYAVYADRRLPARLRLLLDHLRDWLAAAP
jgi:DNA-binding transcriptional LysR family regulator